MYLWKPKLQYIMPRLRFRVLDDKYWAESYNDTKSCHKNPGYDVKKVVVHDVLYNSQHIWNKFGNISIICRILKQE